MQATMNGQRPVDTSTPDGQMSTADRLLSTTSPSARGDSTGYRKHEAAAAKGAARDRPTADAQREHQQQREREHQQREQWHQQQQQMNQPVAPPKKVVPDWLKAQLAKSAPSCVPSPRRRPLTPLFRYARRSLPPLSVQSRCAAPSHEYSGGGRLFVRTIGGERNSRFCPV
jgi:hypothetical protein